jgi:hypothetical protein
MLSMLEQVPNNPAHDSFILFINCEYISYQLLK